MITRQRIVTSAIPAAAVATVVAAALLTTRKDRTVFEPVPSVPSYHGGKPIDVVFAVDTTVSMSGLLEGAKRTVWSIATHIRNTEPDANIRIGLVAFRDVGDVYITKPFALTTDLDAVYSELAAYRAEGGGDVPEDIHSAMHDALKMDWRDGATKMLFVVGDAAANDYGDRGIPTFAESARIAAERGITVNAIRCGWDQAAMLDYQKLAQLGGGEFSTIHQNGGVQQVATPYDDRIAALSSEYDTTAVIVGDDSVRGRYEAKMRDAEAAPAAAKADRAGYYGAGGGGKGMSRTDEDLVGSYATGAADVATIAPEKLPADMRDKNAEELKQELDARVAKRTKIQGELQTLTKQRADYLAKQAKRGEGGFDAKVKEMVEKQLRK
jgi:hypothetical protein